ncbi:MAG: hypothetical protein AAGD86_00480 [Pseudomonadota bacterium]
MIEFTLQVIGALSLVAMAGLCGLILWMRLSNPYAEADALASAGYPLPARITLQRNFDADSVAGTSAACTAAQLRGAGFVPIATFEVAQIPGLAFDALFHPGTGCAAAVYESPDETPAFEVFRRFADGSLLTLTTNTLVDPATVPPAHRLVSVADLTPADTLNLLAQYEPDEAVAAIDDRNFVEVFERSYADNMDWKIKHGCYSPGFLEEITRRFVSGDPSDAQIDAARDTLERALEGEISTACLGNYLNAATLSAGTWEKIRDRVFVIHDRMDRYEMLEVVTYCVGERRAERLFGMFDLHATPDTLSLFEQLNAALPRNERIAQLGRVDEPVPAAICHAL